MYIYVDINRGNASGVYVNMAWVNCKAFDHRCCACSNSIFAVQSNRRYKTHGSVPGSASARRKSASKVSTRRLSSTHT